MAVYSPGVWINIARKPSEVLLLTAVWLGSGRYASDGSFCSGASCQVERCGRDCKQMACCLVRVLRPKRALSPSGVLTPGSPPAGGGVTDRAVGESAKQATFFFFSSRRRHTRLQGDWSSDVCSSD